MERRRVPERLERIRFRGVAVAHQRNLQSILNTTPPEPPSVRQPVAGVAD
jgi:hypothetical protein